MAVEERRLTKDRARHRPLFPHGVPPATMHPRHTAWLLAGLIVLAIVLRFWHLGDWNFQATEMFTLRDSRNPKLTNPRPLGYLLTHYLVGSFRPLDEFGLRLLPAIFGLLAVPVFYLVCRRLADDRAALCSAFLVAVSPLQVMYSQLARYWSLVFLLCAIYPYAIYLGVRERNLRWLIIGLVTAVLALLAHPVSVVPFGGIALYLLLGLRREDLARLWRLKAVRWTVALGLVVGAAILARFVPMLYGWISMHDRNPGSGQFLRPGAPTTPGMKQVIYLANFTESITVPVVLCAIAGIIWFWQGRDRSVGRFLALVAIFHIGFFTLLSFRTRVSQYYLLPSVPVFYLGAGIFIAQLFRLEVPWRSRWLLPALVLATCFTAGGPTLVSDQLDGRRYDFRSSAQWIAPRLDPADIVFSDQPMVTAHYLPQHPVRHLRLGRILLEQGMAELRQAGRGGALWIVAPAPSHAFRPNLKQGGMIEWMYQNCRLRHSTGLGRIDFRQDYLHIYHCPSIPSGSAP